MSDKPREWWIFKGTSKLCDELVPSYDCESLVKCKHEGFYDLISPMDSIEGAVHVIEYKHYESLLLVAREMREALKSVDDWFEDMKAHQFVQMNKSFKEACDNWDSLYQKPLDLEPVKDALQSFDAFNSGEKKQETKHMYELHKALEDKGWKGTVYPRPEDLKRDGI